MNRVPRHGVWAAAALAVSCAGVPPPVTDLPDSPANPAAEEAPWNPQFRYLETEVEAEASGPSGSSPGAQGLGAGAAHEGHEIEQDPTSPAAQDAIEPGYACPLHPEMGREDRPGTCPVCGMALEPQPSPTSAADSL